MTVTELRTRDKRAAAAPHRVLDSVSASPQFDERLSLLAIGARWITVALGALVVARAGYGIDDIAATLLLASVASYVSVRHHRGAAVTERAPVLCEMVLAACAVALSGGLTSPYVLAPAIPLMLAGYVLSERQAVVLAYLAVAATVGLSLVQRTRSETPRSVALVGVVYLLCGLLGVFTRRAVSEMDHRHNKVMDEVSRLTQANNLLVALHGLAQRMPATLDFAAVMGGIRQSLDAEFPHSVVSLHVRNAATNQWHQEIAYGVRSVGVVTDEELPEVLKAVLRRTNGLLVHEYLNTEASGISSFARSGIYCALRARGEVIGVLAVEHDDADAFDDANLTRLTVLSHDFALSVDNAVWFSRLRTLGAETERARIARDLHDRIAQSLAYVAFELERLCATEEPIDRSQLPQLREVIHEVVTELRDTLYDLRATVTDDQDLAVVAQQYLERMSARHNFAARYEGTTGSRLPKPIEQELWRIVQEGLHNVAKHANADRVNLRYEIAGPTALVELRDDGCGFVPRQATSGHYGLVGMRERADAIGAQLEITSTPGRGTTIRISLEVAA